MLLSNRYQTKIIPKSIHPPELPTELWLDILRWATLIPGILDPSRSHDFSRTPPYDREQEAIKASLATKRHLVLVCKTWNDLASRYLYESILLDKIGSSRRLSDTLNDPKNKRGYFRTLGECTKRVDLSLEALRNYMNPFEVAQELMYLPSVFQHLTNLTILNFSVVLSGHSGVQVPDSVLRSIARACGPRLEAITWYTHRLNPPKKNDWLAFLTETPNIKSIRCPTLPFLEHKLREPSTLENPECENPSRLSLLQQLYIPVIFDSPVADDGTFHPLDDLPSLRRLTIEARHVEPPTHEWTILHKYGSTLETLQLIILMVPEHYQQTILIVSQTCPNLNRLDLSFIHFRTMRVAPLPPTIEVLGLQCDTRCIDEPACLLLFDVLLKIGNGHKKLKVIQFLAEDNIRELHERHQGEVVNAARILKTDLGVDLHDHMGRLLYS